LRHIGQGGGRVGVVDDSAEAFRRANGFV